MAVFSNLRLTSAGTKALLEMQAGKTLNFSRIGLGSGKNTGNYWNMTELVMPKVKLPIAEKSVKSGSNHIVFIAKMTNETLNEGFEWRELGLYYRDDNGKDILFAASNAGDKYDYIPAITDKRYLKQIRLASAISDMESITIVETEGLVWVDFPTFNNTVDEIESAIEQQEIEDFQGYKAVDGNSYAGMASNNGINVGYIKGRSVQDGEPTPDVPVEIKSFGDEAVNFHSHGFQLIDAEKVASYSIGGATITNNRDGSFTVTGSGTLTESVNKYYQLSHEDTVKLLKSGNLVLNAHGETYPYFYVQFRYNNGNSNISFQGADKNTVHEILQSALEDETSALRVGFYGSTGSTIVAGTIKPMLYQDGDGTWEEFKAVETTEVAFPEPLRSLPNGVCDTYENRKITRRVKELTLTGGEAWAASTSYNNTYYIRKPTDMIYSSAVLCDRFRYVAIDADTTQNEVVFTGNFINFKDDTFASVDEFKTWLASNPMTILYELAQPVIEEFEIPTLASYNPNTVVQHDSVEANLITWHILKGGQGGASNEALEAHIADKNNPHNVTAEQVGAAEENHTHTADKIGSGVLAGRVMANADTSANLGNSQVRNINAGTTDLVAGTSTLASGAIYLVYE